MNYSNTGKVLYGLAFMVALPAALTLWAWRLDGGRVGNLPVPDLKLWGIAVCLGGLLWMGWSMLLLIREGRGLPMNAYPTTRRVERGPYAVTDHPIYLGFCAVVAGTALWFSSPAGLWVVLPIAIAGCASLVVGYEGPATRQRLGPRVTAPILRIPPVGDQPATKFDKLSAYVLLFLPWLLIYEGFIFLGPAADARPAYFAFELGWPVIEWTELVYFGAYFFIGLAPLITRRSGDLRRFMTAGLWGATFIFLCFICLPLTAPPRSFETETWLGLLLEWERSFDGEGAAFPSFHAFWALLAASLWADTFRGWRIALYALGLVIAVSCITTGMHAIIDVVAGVLVFGVVRHLEGIWKWLLRTAERLANSWREWRIGKLRIINHGFYAGAGTFLGLLLGGAAAGGEAVGGVALVAACSLLSAGLWGQWLEGSSVLMRPFGYYGGLFGGIAGMFIAALLGFDFWMIAAAFALAGPWIQACGRLRCFVQGCCHGKPCRNPSQGIIYRHPRTRAAGQAGLGGRAIYPTQLYSILANLVTGALLLRFWWMGMPSAWLAGFYLIANGIARFAEEGFRGEPQTPGIRGLPVYQWLAVFCVGAGILITTLPSPGLPTVGPPTPAAWGVAVLFSLLATFCLGTDFPESNRRFSRLGPVDPMH